ncbi:MBL fold metallo-hydrolase, partial [Klebsiella pneumoniae]|nr:MBL fold metallo-hydrolase [Klebsiella pneumoniae]
MPEPLEGNRIMLEGESILIEGLNSPAPERSYVWVPSLSAVMGGVLVSENIHVWLADTQTPESRQYWQQSLKSMQDKHPATVVPGH